MVTKNFPRDYLRRELDLPFASVENHIVDQSRWSIHHEIVFRDKDGKFYQTCYSVGATECQDEGPWDDEPVVQCVQVEQQKVLVLRWVPVEGDEKETPDGLDTP
ncbi:hypothetical protein D1159_03660 [Pseudoflavonifractor sp. 524-17]|uniref:hypothetical protein n=1 Tax=Pseudoflavonifractor sp. 524-17 TaxID=2304577 RepID=UPI001379E72F|nr:hypothetical protein [Pseudoflavonifractor sp. 524-17]NCE63696.1 hypothetical protein [Pseudoflavonifractor sp. 524-17]